MLGQHVSVPQHVMPCADARHANSFSEHCSKHCCLGHSSVLVQKYVEQIRQLAMMCHQGAMGAAAADLEILVSMRVSTICPSCLLLINAHGADAVGSHMSPCL